MRTFAILFIGCLFYPLASGAQKVNRLDPKRLLLQNAEIELVGDAIHLKNATQKNAIAWFQEVNFSDGVIEFDLKGKDERGESFVGIAFHGLNDSTYCVVYFRPFNFRSPERSNHSVQFVDLPGHDWDLLREQFTGLYENKVNQTLDPNDWFHAKIVVAFPEVKVYVNNSEQPSLVVKQISLRSTGKVGLWIDSGDGWFRNLTYSSR